VAPLTETPTNLNTVATAIQYTTSLEIIIITIILLVVTIIIAAHTTHLEKGA
jgi:hypothetical protein